MDKIKENGTTLLTLNKISDWNKAFHLHFNHISGIGNNIFWQLNIKVWSAKTDQSKRTTSGYGPLYLENFHLDIKCWLNLSTKISESFGTMEDTYNVRKLCKIQFWLAILNFIFLFKLTLMKPQLQLWWLGKICSLPPTNSNHPRLGWENQARSHHSTHGLQCKFIGERQNKSQHFW